MTPHQTVFRLTLSSTLHSIGRVESFLKKISKTVHLNEIQFHKVMVSLTEAVNNAIVHGNKLDEQKKVRVTCEILPGWLLFMVNDEGGGFNPSRISNPLRKKNLLRESGRGIFLMRTLMDKVEFETQEDDGEQVRLWLDLNK